MTGRPANRKTKQRASGNRERIQRAKPGDTPVRTRAPAPGPGRRKKTAKANTIEALAYGVSGFGVFDWDMVRNVNVWNANHFILLGYLPDEVLPTYDNWLARVHPDDRALVEEHARAFMATGTTDQHEYRVRWLDGTVRFVREHSVIERNRAGVATRYYGVMTDITDVRQNEIFNRALVSINHIIHSARDIEAIFMAVMTESVKALGCDMASVVLKRDDEWVVSYVLGMPAPFIGATYRIDELPNGWRAIQEGKPVAIDDVHKQPEYDRREVRELNICSLLTIPLTIRQQELGVVYFIFNRNNIKFESCHIDFAGKLSSAISLALDNTQLIANLQNDVRSHEHIEQVQKEAHRRLELLAETASALLQSNQPVEVIGRICQKALGVLRCEMFFNYILDEKTRRLRLIASDGFPGRDREKIEWLSVGEGADGYVAQENTPMIVHRLPSSSDLRIRLLKSYGVRAYASYPLTTNAGMLLGTLSFGALNRDSFTEEDVAVMQSLADHVAAALDRMKNREAMRRSEARYHALFRNMSEGFALLDVMYDGQGFPADYRFVDVNHSFEKMSGMVRDQFIGRSVTDFLPAMYRPLLAQHASVVMTGEPVRFEYVEDASHRVFEVYAYRPADHQVAVILMDVTQLKLSEQREQLALAMASAAQTAKDALQSMGEGVLLLDMSGRVTSVNRAFEKMIGRSGAAVEGFFLEDLLKEATTGNVVDLTHEITRAIRGEDVNLAGFELIDARGNRTPVFPAVSLIRDQENQPTAVIFSLRDISDLKKAERDREKYEEKLKNLARDLALTDDRARHRIAGQIHDTVIQTLSLSNIKLGLVRNKLTETNLETLATDVGTVRSLLTEAINESRALMAELTPPLLHELGIVPALNDLAERMSKLHNITINVKDDEQPKRFDKSVERIVFRAVRELIINAIKHANASEIIVDLWCLDAHMQVRVADNGRGFVVPKDQAFVHNKHGGFGLFHISERIAELGGIFTIHASPGAGTVAELSLPLPVAVA